MTDAPDPTPSFSLACENVLPLPTGQASVDQIAGNQIKGNQIKGNQIKGNQIAANKIAGQVQAALANPTNYPSIADSVVPGDHVVLAIDPTVPGLRSVIAGVILALSETEAGQIDAVLWDEATDDQIAMISEEMGPSSKVIRHHGDLRRDVRYLAADDSADPIYINRLLVDADLVLPIASGRFGFDQDQQDCTGIYPMLVDSASRKRFTGGSASEVPASQTAWLLGVQMMLSIVPGADDQVQRILAGSIGWISEELAEIAETELPSRGQADLVVAVVENGTPQTWENAARAIQAASAIALEDATIVLWSNISAPIPTVSPEALEDEDDGFADADSEAAQNETADNNVADNNIDEDFPAWNADVAVARELAEMSTRYRLLIRSKLESEAVEMAGFGAIANADQLTRLSRGFDVGCVLRRASYLAPAATDLGSLRLEK